MSLHIQMSEEAEAELRKSARRNQLSSLAASLMLVLIGGGTLFFTALVIATEQPAEFIAYVAPSDNAAPSNNPTQQDLTSKATTPSSNVSPSVIVAVGAASPVAMAPVDLDMNTEDMGMAVDIDMGFDADMGEALGDSGSGMGSNSANGSALEGTFYDFKQTKNGAMTGLSSRNEKGGWNLNRERYCETLNSFVRTWSPAAFSKFYQSPTKLYASNFYLPSCDAAYAPIAYQCQKKVEPSCWAAVYRGKVRAPKSGKFRFVGTGDELLAVRFNRKMVLESGWVIPSTYEKGKGHATSGMGSPNWSEASKAYHKAIREGKDRNHKDYVIAHYDGIPKWNTELGGLTAGEPFDVKEGQTYNIEILVSEGPGGEFGFALLVDEYDEDSKSWKFGKPNARLDLFRTNFSEPNKEEITKMLEEAKCKRGNQFPPYNPDSLVWVAVP